MTLPAPRLEHRNAPVFRTRFQKSAGFTFVELVVVLALLGIVSATIASRWFTTDAFGADTLRSQLIAQARLAQKTALANTAADVSLVVSAVGDQWRYQIFLDNGGGPVVLTDLTADAEGITIAVTTGATQSLGAGVDLDVTYDSLGNLSAVLVNGIAQTLSLGIGFNLMSTHQLCISPLGYAHAGTCV